MKNGVRYATWQYDVQGRAISSEHANGVDRYAVDFASLFGRTITDPLGTVRMYGLQPMLDVQKVSTIIQPAGAGSNQAVSSTSYDANGNIATTTDLNGWSTSYTYDLIRNLELRRIEAADTALARTTTTLWHPAYRLPAEISSPLLKTSYTYDTQGNVLSKTELPTGPGGGVARTWTYTYNAVGQVLTATGPRTDIVDKTTNTYDTRGNLTSITNAVGHVTTMSNYDANGRVGQITDPNGLVTTLTYTERGWLSKLVSAGEGITQTTSYEYDGVGQMTRVTLPDNSSLTYTYDDAHRLTKISDSLGNSINYTLDNIGNRINETVTDSSGNLARQISRVYDAVNRLQTVTGAAQ
ncbi:MAG: RHS repeat protein [Burkholderiales bacterium]|nr:RHS repeat protein [Burkholderiales bacterium]MBI3730904.1 RHS repeat protein [Burkholderiales bacterium]